MPTIVWEKKKIHIAKFPGITPILIKKVNNGETVVACKIN